MPVAHSPTPWPWSALPMAAANPLFCGACTSHAARARFAWHACYNDRNACKNAWHARNPPSPRARANPACISVHAGSRQRAHERKQRRSKQMLAPVHAPSAKTQPRMHACNADAPQTRCAVEQRPPNAKVASLPRLRVGRLDLAARGARRGRPLRLLWFSARVYAPGPI